jgi:hypothetical protein
VSEAPGPPTSHPLNVTANARLDFALRLGAENWERAVRRAGQPAMLAWMRGRFDRPDLVDEAADLVAAFLEAEDDEERAVARAELAEVVENEDDELADTLWEGVLAHGRATADPEYLFEATRRLAIIAEQYGDPLAAAEYYIDFLNWRREDANASEVEPVEVAFEEVIRLAEADGEQRAAALFNHRYANYQRHVDTEREAATAGDWEPRPEPYESWT